MQKVKPNLGHTWPQPELPFTSAGTQTHPIPQNIRAAPDLSQCAIRTKPIPSSPQEFNLQESGCPVSAAGHHSLQRSSSDPGPLGSEFHSSLWSLVFCRAETHFPLLSQPGGLHTAALGASQCCPAHCQRGWDSSMWNTNYHPCRNRKSGRKFQWTPKYGP